MKVKKLVALKLSGMITRIGRIRKRMIATQIARKPQYQSALAGRGIGGSAAIRVYPSLTLSMPTILS